MRRLIARIGDTARLMVGLPSYETYLDHMAQRHPHCVPMDKVAFFRDRQNARYRGGGGRCC